MLLVQPSPVPGAVDGHLVSAVSDNLTDSGIVAVDVARVDAANSFSVGQTVRTTVAGVACVVWGQNLSTATKAEMRYALASELRQADGSGNFGRAGASDPFSAGHECVCVARQGRGLGFFAPPDSARQQVPALPERVPPEPLDDLCEEPRRIHRPMVHVGA